MVHARGRYPYGWSRGRQLNIQYRDQDLDHEYSPSEWSHRMSPDEVIQSHISVLTSESKKSRESIECELDVTYGDGEKQKLQIFGANTLPYDAPIFVYIHGGYWKLLGLEMSSFMVGPLNKAGAVVVAVGYDLAPAVGMDKIVSEVKQAIAYVLHMAKRRESRGVYIGGHSAGGHLAAMMLSVDWLKENMMSSCLIKGALLVSGVFDLRPLVTTIINKPIQMTPEVAWSNSPANHISAITKQSASRTIAIAFAEHDPPEFRRQSKELYQDLQKAGAKVKLIDVPNTDHFDVNERLRQPDYVLTKELISMMQLN